MSDGGVTYTDENGVEQQGLFYGSNPVIKYDFKTILESTKIPDPDTTLAVDVVASDATITTAQQAAMNSLSSILEENLPEEIRPGVTEVFESTPELASIGTAGQYSAYLDTIFPDSKVKDIVYHGSDNNKLESFRENLRSGIHFGTIQQAKGRRIATDTEFKKDFKFLPVLLNLKNPLKSKDFDWEKAGDAFVIDWTPDTDLSDVDFTQYLLDNKIATGKDIQNSEGDFDIINKKGYDGVVYKNEGAGENTGEDSFAVSKPEQIHILGNKQDIEGFKKFVSKGQSVAKTVNNSVGTQSKAAESLDSLQNLLNFTPQSERNGKTAQEVLDYLKVAQISHLPEGYNPFKRCS
jgi:hypothetical protein